MGNLIFFCTRALHAATGVGPTCRFEPTCSQYAQQALGLHGLFRGTYLTLRRLLRCHPWGRSGWDPVPGGEQR